MKSGCLFIFPSGLLALIIAGLLFSVDPPPADPDSIVLFVAQDYQEKAKAYANRGNRQEAMDTCEAMEVKDRYDESNQDICFLGVYKVLGDIDGRIAIYEKQLAKELADGDGGALTKHALEDLYKERDKKK